MYLSFIRTTHVRIIQNFLFKGLRECADSNQGSLQIDNFRISPLSMGWRSRMFNDLKVGRKTTELVVQATVSMKHSASGFIFRLQPIWRCLGRVLECLGRSWRCLGGFVGASEASWGGLGAAATCLEVVLKLFEVVLKRFPHFSSWFEFSLGCQNGFLGLHGIAFLGPGNVFETMGHVLCILKVCKAVSETELSWFSKKKQSLVTWDLGCNCKWIGNYRMWENIWFSSGFCMILAIRVCVWRTSRSSINHTNTKAMQDSYAWWIWARLGSPKHLGGVLGVVKACSERMRSRSDGGWVKAFKPSLDQVQTKFRPSLNQV